MRGDDQLRRLLLNPRVLLNQARDADPLFGEHLPKRGQHAGAIVDPDAVAGPRLDLTHEDHADTIVKAERRPALHTTPDLSGEVDHVAYLGAPGERRSRPPGDKHLLSY